MTFIHPIGMKIIHGQEQEENFQITNGDLTELGNIIGKQNISADSLIGRAPDYESEDPSSTLGWRSKRLFVYL
jgi:hypothetical protein